MSTPREELLNIFWDGDPAELTTQLVDSIIAAGWKSPDEVKQARRKAWDDAHRQMCRIGNEFCSLHKPYFWEADEES